jgi:hypothetical protein
MAKEPSEEYRAFDATMGELLKVSKANVDDQVEAHQERQVVGVLLR